MTDDMRWLTSLSPFVRSELPAPPARVLEIGCGPLGGFVPALRTEGYAAIGIDPRAPASPEFHQIEYEQFVPPQPVDAVVACTSLHHVADLDAVLDRIRDALVPGGRLVVVEWARERLDERTARWCFARVGTGDGEPGWLHRHHDRWQESGLPWETYLESWAAEEGLHTGERIVAGLDARFERVRLETGPYCFPGLEGTSEADEQAAIDAGDIEATGIRYAGRAA
jgi:SAM-dependent methyltransferase